jgi:gamma-glutamylaminecyclotransferase
MSERIFVYGTLMRGECNHHWLKGARLLGPALTAPRFQLWSLGSYPVLCLQGLHRIHGEVYQVSPARLRDLDTLEEYPHYYLRRRIRTAYGLAWVYYQRQPPRDGTPLPGGDWRRRTGRPLIRHGFAGVSVVQGRGADLA